MSTIARARERAASHHQKINPFDSSESESNNSYTSSSSGTYENNNPFDDEATSSKYSPPGGDRLEKTVEEPMLYRPRASSTRSLDGYSERGVEFPSSEKVRHSSLSRLETGANAEPVQGFCRPKSGSLAQAQVRGRSSPEPFLPSRPERVKLQHGDIHGDRNYNYNNGGQRGELLTGASNLYRSQESYENKALQDLQTYAVDQPKETTSTIRNCLKVVEETKDVAGKTMTMLHEQGDQIRRTHETAVKVDQYLSAGEKLLANLGGIFSLSWKPKKTHTITGPLLTGGESYNKQGSSAAAERGALGLNTHNVGETAHSTGLQAQPVLEVERAEQDDDLVDLSNILGQLKGMSLEMNSEISRQNEGVDHLHDDVQELNFRVKGANERGRRLLRR